RALGFRKLDTLRSWPRDLATIEIDDGATQACATNLHRPIHGTTQHCLDACEELAGRERFDNVIVGAHLQPAHPVLLGATGRKDDNRQSGSNLADLDQNFQAVTPWKQQ